jgi:phosphoribosylamine--glycine ligase
MDRHQIPTGAYFQTDSLVEALKEIHSGRFGLPIVIKADGLAAGKGVVIAESLKDAESAVRQMMQLQTLGDSGRRIVLEEFLVGEEASFLVVADGVHALPLAPSQDHKRVFDHDQGPNTGGMGAYSSDWILSPHQQREVMARFVLPTLEGMGSEGMAYKGILYFGLMLTSEGIRLLEYNARLGDPETQPVLFRLETDLIQIFEGTLEGSLCNLRPTWDPCSSVCVVMASGGYPGDFKRGFEIRGLDRIKSDASIMVFHAGTEKRGEKTFTTGGRVLGVTAKATTLGAAVQKAYQTVGQIHFEDQHFRRDIGNKGLLKENAGSPSPMLKQRLAQDALDAADSR